MAPPAALFNRPLQVIDAEAFIAILQLFLRGDSEESYRALTDAIKAFMSETGSEKSESQKERALFPELKATFATLLRPLLGHFGVEDRNIELLHKRLRIVALVPSDSSFADYSPTGIRTALALRTGGLKPVVGQRGSSRHYGKLFSAKDGERSIRVDLRDLLIAAGEAIRPPANDETLSWLRDKISATNEMIAYLTQRLDYVSAFPLSDFPRNLTEKAPERILERFSSSLIVRCLLSSIRGSIALKRWRSAFFASVQSRRGKMSQSQKNSLALFRDETGLACAALDVARKSLQAGTFKGFVFFNPDAFDSVFHTPTPVGSQPSVAKRDDSNQPDKEFFEILDREGDRIAAALEHSGIEPSDVLTLMEEELSEEDIFDATIEDLIGEYCDNYRQRKERLESLPPPESANVEREVLVDLVARRKEAHEKVERALRKLEKIEGMLRRKAR